MPLCKSCHTNNHTRQSQTRSHWSHLESHALCQDFSYLVCGSSQPRNVPKLPRDGDAGWARTTTLTAHCGEEILQEPHQRVSGPQDNNHQCSQILLTCGTAEHLHGVFGNDGPTFGGATDMSLCQDHRLQHEDQQGRHRCRKLFHAANICLLQEN